MTYRVQLHYAMRVRMHDNKIMADFKKLAASSFASLLNIKNEISKMVKKQVGCTLKSLDVVTRTEFEAVKKSTAKVLDKIDGIKNNKGGSTMAVAKKTTAKKVAKKPAAKKAVKKVVKKSSK